VKYVCEFCKTDFEDVEKNVWCCEKAVNYGPYAPAMQDLVSHLLHYNSGRIEVIEAIEDWKLNYHRGNSIKYIARAGKKHPDKEIEDLEKAKWYLNRDIERLKAGKENREMIKPNEMPKNS
jgi:uncharacterized protein YwgA